MKILFINSLAYLFRHLEKPIKPEFHFFKIRNTPCSMIEGNNYSAVQLTRVPVKRGVCHYGMLLALETAVRRGPIK